MASSPEQAELIARNPLKRWCIRIFVVFAFAIIAIDTSPAIWPYATDTKLAVRRGLDATGLWQGEWPLFAPDPVINNAWITAEIYSADGDLQYWNSPYWADVAALHKFRQFRQINYYTRLPFNGQTAINDFCDYIARQQIGPGVKGSARKADQPNDWSEGKSSSWRLRLVRNKLNFVAQADGSLLPRSDVIWVSSSEQLADRVYTRP